MPKCPSKACGCAVITLWMIVNVVLLIITIVNYLIPYIRIARYLEAQCRVEAYFYTTQFICSCGFACESLYPCLIVHVSLNTTDDKMWVVSLYKDDAQQNWVTEAAPDEQEMCSLHVCEQQSQYNRMIVEEFAAKYKHDIGEMIKCFYDPWQLSAGAVLKINWPGLEVFHAVFWPATFIVIGALACIIFCRWCRERERMTENAEGAEGKGLTAAESERSKREIAREKEEEVKRQKKLEEKKKKEEKRRQKEQRKYEMQVKRNQEKEARRKLQQQKKLRQVEESVFHADTLSESEEDNEKIQVVIRDGKVDKVGKWS